MREIREDVERYAAAFDASVLSACDAERVVRDASAAENMLATVKALAAKRAAEGGGWRRSGARSPAHELAARTGTSVTQARAALDTAEKLLDLPELDAAARRGELSPAQAAPIADAASADPGAERRLVDKARRASLGELRDECARTKAAAEPDDEARHAAIHRSRFLRRTRCADGAGELRYRSTLEEVAELFAIAQGHAKAAFDVARLEGRREPEEAYLADGLRAGAGAGAGTGTGAGAGRGAGSNTDTDSDTVPPQAGGGEPGTEPGSGPDAPGAAIESGAAATKPGRKGRVRLPVPTKIVARLDWDVLVRGWPIDGEVCEIAGLGPVPVSVVRAMMATGDAFLAAVVTKGTDVVNVAHLGRRPTAAQATALDWLSPTCTTLGCDATDRLETDHRLDWADTKVTLLGWLERHCHACHHKKTNLGWALVDGTGKRPLVPPDDPRHPRHRHNGNGDGGPSPPG